MDRGVCGTSIVVCDMRGPRRAHSAQFLMEIGYVYSLAWNFAAYVILVKDRRHRYKLTWVLKSQGALSKFEHFNLFSVSQICDKKNKVLFTDTDCLVLKEDFQLPDESQVQKHPWMNPPDGHKRMLMELQNKSTSTKEVCLMVTSQGYTHFKTDTPAGTQKTNINAGPSSSNGPSVMKRNADYVEELAKLQRQEYEAKDAAARYGYLFSQATAEILCQAEAEIRNQGVSAVRDPAGIDSAVRDPAGIDSAVRDTAAIDSAGGVSAGSPSAGSDPAGGNPADSFQPAGSFEPAAESNPAVSSSVSADFITLYADESTLSLLATMQEENATVHQPASMETYPFTWQTCNKGQDGFFEEQAGCRRKSCKNKAGCLHMDTDKRRAMNMNEALIDISSSTSSLYSRLSAFLLQHNYKDVLLTRHCTSRIRFQDILVGESVRTATTPMSARPHGKMETDPSSDLVLVPTSNTPLTSSSECSQKISSTGIHTVGKSPISLGRRLISCSVRMQTILLHLLQTDYVAAASCCAQRTKHIEIRHHFIRDANEKNLIQVLKIHTNDNVADLLTKAFDGPRFEYLLVHIGMLKPSSELGEVVILSAGRLVSAGRTMVLLVVILSAGRLVSAGRTMILLVVILPAGCFVFAGSYGLCC
ncbi:hypothetical protein Tco_0954229 [Tanacetum coccineum]|uniref:Uncharacterized protein n=1 Tax=Tanacetum coccineum TaxID=301880 RepID=A0ABQ5E310_9ASTR